MARGAELKRGSTWSYAIDLAPDPSSGKRRQRWKGGFRTRKEAEAAVRSFAVAADEGRVVERSRRTVGEYLRDWLTALRRMSWRSRRSRWPEQCGVEVVQIDHDGGVERPRDCRSGTRRGVLIKLATGPHATADPDERARRQDRLQRAEATFDPLAFDAKAARSYGRIYAAVAASGRKARGPRAVDLLIAAVAVANDLPLYTRNPDDFEAVDSLLNVITT